MSRLSILAAASMLVAPNALAQDVAPGTYVQLSKLHRQDAFFRDRKQLLGLVCVVTDPGLVENRAGLYGGPTRCGDGQEYYWYLAGFEVVAPEVAAVFGLTDAATANAASPWTVGTRVRIRSVSSADAYAASGTTLSGKECTVKDAPLTATGADWWAGSLMCDSGGEFYFYQVAVDPVEPSGAAGTASAGTASAGAAAGTSTGANPFGIGALVKITGVDPLDQLSSSGGALVGQACSVVGAPLVSSAPGYWAGQLFCPDGKTYQFLKVGVTAQ